MEVQQGAREGFIPRADLVLAPHGVDAPRRIGRQILSNPDLGPYKPTPTPASPKGVAFTFSF
jgi:hypothetical protein